MYHSTTKGTHKVTVVRCPGELFFEPPLPAPTLSKSAANACDSIFSLKESASNDLVCDGQPGRLVVDRDVLLRLSSWGQDGGGQSARNL